jgi:hypothetical protein
MNLLEAYKEIDTLESRIDDEVYPSCSHNTEVLVYAQTKGILVFLKAILDKQIKEDNNGRTTK